MRNPEFIRNLWLELTPQRLIGMPVILALVFFVIFVGSSNDVEKLVPVALLGFVALAGGWGALLASSSLLEEFREGTWDAQRTSGMGPWAMTWGKLLGGAAYAWYGGLICLLVMALVMLRDSVSGALQATVSLVALAVMLQALALLAALLSGKRADMARRNPGAAVLLIALISLSPMMALFADSRSQGETVTWYWLTLPASTFVLASLAAFAGWAVLGAYRAMCVELQLRGIPWAWVAFVAFVVVYGSGFMEAEARHMDWSIDVLVVQLSYATGLCAFLTYAFVIAEPKDWVRIRRTLAHWRADEVSTALRGVPLWAVNAMLVLACAAFLAVAIVVVAPHEVRLLWVLLGALLFMVRDIAIVLASNLGPSQRRADAAALVYLAALYLLVPVLFGVLDFENALGLFFPVQAYENPLWLVPIAGQSLVAVALAWTRWRRHQSALA